MLRIVRTECVLWLLSLVCVGNSWISNLQAADPADKTKPSTAQTPQSPGNGAPGNGAPGNEMPPLKPAWPSTADGARVTVTLFEGLQSHTEFPHELTEETFRFTAPQLALHRLPQKFIAGGARALRQGPVMLQAFLRAELPAGKHELLIRSPGLSRLWIDGQIVATTPPRRLFMDAHQPFVVYQPDLPWLRVPHVGDHEVRAEWQSSGQTHEVVLETLVGSARSRCELGETLVATRQGDGMFTLLKPVASDAEPVHLVDAEFLPARAEFERELVRLDRQSLADASATEEAFWQARHELARAVIDKLPPLDVPPGIAGLQAENAVDLFIAADLTLVPSDPASAERLEWLNAKLGDLAFLRRLSLDTVGVPPTIEEIEAYLAEADRPRARQAAIDRLLSDDRWADHWVSYWQDVLAENPNILKPKLNNTGPFRWWLYDALVSNKPMDRFATELIRMEGDVLAGGPAGFSWATENDVPMAEKAHIVASAFLSVDMKCARCHDAPYHPWSQKDLFSIAAMLESKPLEVPESSSVPVAFFERTGRESPIAVTLRPGALVQPQWPADALSDKVFGDGDLDPRLFGREPSPREELAARVTRAENHRFAATLVNRLWTRWMGWGLMESTDDWYEVEPRQSEVLEYLARELVRSGYDLKHVARLILQSRTYQRPAVDEADIDRPLRYTAAWRHRLSAEQVVDSLHVVAGVPMDTEAITFDPEASQRLENFLNLGYATRAWQLTSLSNERDRPSLSLPKAATVVACLEAFGWRQSRQSPLTHRETEANMVQPGVVANGVLSGSVTRLTDQSETTELAIAANTVDAFIETLFLRVLTREPTEAELSEFRARLHEGFADRHRQPSATEKTPPVSRGFATWSNHFAVEANLLMRDRTLEVAAGPEPTERLSSDWRERAEDALWALVNAPEFQFLP